jgi:hypothetical protein
MQIHVYSVEVKRLRNSAKNSSPKRKGGIEGPPLFLFVKFVKKVKSYGLNLAG